MSSSLPSAPALQPTAEASRVARDGDVRARSRRSRTSSTWIRSGRAFSPAHTALPPAHAQASRCASLPASNAAYAAPSSASTSTSGIPTADRKLRMVTRSSAENTFRPGLAREEALSDGPATAAAAARRRMLIGIDMLVAGGPPRVLPGPKNEVTGFASAIVFELVLGKPATRA
ncbi:hypothetical protein DFH11DRAFT_1733235 [Phellopilus nigrolimitatus]|nr:hypothetical protein DFH11DRAFT_1733235 [Phellopilus nigrolimitatus]